MSSSSADIHDDDERIVEPVTTCKPEEAAENSSCDEDQSTSGNPRQAKVPVKDPQEPKTDHVEVKEGGIEQSS